MTTKMRVTTLDTGGVRVYTDIFASGMAKIAQMVGDYVDKQVQVARAVTFDATSQLCVDIRIDTPRVTGRAQAHFQVTDKKDDAVYVPSATDKPVIIREQIIDDYIGHEIYYGRSSRTGEFGQTIPLDVYEKKFSPQQLYIENPAPYIEFLEFGGSNQSPEGMVRINVINWGEYIKNSIYRILKLGESVKTAKLARGALVNGIKHDYLHNYPKFERGILHVQSSYIRESALRGRKRTAGDERNRTFIEQFTTNIDRRRGK